MGGLHDPEGTRRGDLAQTGAHVIMVFAGGDEEKPDALIFFPHEAKKFQHFIHTLIPLKSAGIEEDFVPRGEAEFGARGVAEGRVGMKLFLIGQAGDGKAMFAGGEGKSFLDASAQGIRDIQDAVGAFQAEPDDDALEGEGEADGEAVAGFRGCVEAFFEFGEGFAADVEEDAGASEAEPFEEGCDHGGIAGAGVDDGSAGQASRECEAEEGHEGEEEGKGREGEGVRDEGSADAVGQEFAAGGVEEGSAGVCGGSAEDDEVDGGRAGMFVQGAQVVNDLGLDDRACAIEAEVDEQILFHHG